MATGTLSVHFDGIDELNTVAAQLDASTVRLLVQGEALVRSAGFAVQAYAQQAAPVDTGFLRGSITVAFLGNLRMGILDAVVTAEADYSAYVEYGTSRRAPAAFMGPAIDTVGASFAVAIAALADPFGIPGQRLR